jgi:hypothetical protein
MDRRRDERDPPGGPADVRDEAWYRAVAEILELRTDGDHVWAETRLAALQQEIEATHRVLDWQRRAIAGIRGSEWLPSRKYDEFGYGRRWK